MRELLKGGLFLDFVHFEEAVKLLLHSLLVLEQVLQFVLRLQVLSAFSFEIGFEGLYLGHCLLFLLPEVSQVIHELAL